MSSSQFAFRVIGLGYSCMGSGLMSLEIDPGLQTYHLCPERTNHQGLMYWVSTIVFSNRVFKNFYKVLFKGLRSIFRSKCTKLLNFFKIPDDII